MRRKKDWIQFLVWMRNGSAFCISWFLILWLLYNSVYGIKVIQTTQLVKLVAVSVAGVFLFSFFFTGLFLKQWRFLGRLTGFMVTVSMLEGAAFYWLGLFVRTGTWLEWGIFAGIILILYGICILIYQVYSRKAGELYTQALEQYQQNRSRENGEQNNK